MGLAWVCGAVAYLLYFRLMQDVGPVRTLTVTLTYLILLWARLFLHETMITWPMLAGCALIIAGTLSVLRRQRSPAPIPTRAARGT